MKHISHRFHKTGEAVFTNDFSFTFGCFAWIWFQIGFYISVWLLTGCGGWQRTCMVDLLINDKLQYVGADLIGWWRIIISYMHCYIRLKDMDILFGNKLTITVSAPRWYCNDNLSSPQTRSDTFVICLFSVELMLKYVKIVKWYDKW